MKEYEKEFKEIKKELSGLKLMLTIEIQTLKSILTEIQRGNRK